MPVCETKNSCQVGKVIFWLLFLECNKFVLYLFFYI